MFFFFCVSNKNINFKPRNILKDYPCYLSKLFIANKLYLTDLNELIKYLKINFYQY